MRKAVSLLLVAALAVCLAMLSGCASGSYVELRILSIGKALRPGDEATFTAIGVSAKGETRVVKATWSFKGSSGMLINSEGPTVDFLAVSPGKGTLSVVKGNASGSLEIEVYSPVLASLSISPLESTVARSSTATFTAFGLDQHKRPIPVEPEWSIVGAIGSLSADKGPSVVLTTPGIGADGMIKATQDGICAEAIVHVYPLPSVLTNIYIYPYLKILYPGDTERFFSECFDQYGARMYQIPVNWRVDSSIGSCSHDSGQETYFTAQQIGQGKIYASYEGIEASSTITVAEKVTLSGELRDSETNAPVDANSIYAYLEDGDYGIQIGAATVDSSGIWSMEVPIVPGYSRILLQPRLMSYFVRTIAVPNEAASGIAIKMVPKQPEYFQQFMWDTCGERIYAVDNEVFRGFKIIKQSDDGGTFSEAQADYLASLLQDASNKVGEFLGLETYSIDIITGTYTASTDEICIIPSETVAEGDATFEGYGGYLVTGGIIRINPNNTTPESMRWMLLHAIAHVIYAGHTQIMTSILEDVHKEYDEFMPMDLKGAAITTEPTFKAMIDGKIVPDYLENIIGPSFGISHLKHYNQ